MIDAAELGFTHALSCQTNVVDSFLGRGWGGGGGHIPLHSSCVTVVVMHLVHSIHILPRNLPVTPHALPSNRGQDCR